MFNHELYEPIRKKTAIDVYKDNMFYYLKCVKEFRSECVRVNYEDNQSVIVESKIYQLIKESKEGPDFEDCKLAQGLIDELWQNKEFKEKRDNKNQEERKVKEAKEQAFNDLIERINQFPSVKRRLRLEVDRVGEKVKYQTRTMKGYLYNINDLEKLIKRENVTAR